MKRLRSWKLCAALVIIAWLATLVSLWGMLDAGRRAVTPQEGCQPKDLQNIGLRLEMAGSPGDALKILNGDPIKAACLRSGAAAQVRADYLFIPAYSGLILALFLFVRAFWIAPPREKGSIGWALLTLGLFLAAAMLVGDVVENLHLTKLIKLAEADQQLPKPLFDRLGFAGQLKWGALAASALVLALTWTARSPRLLVWVPRLLGLAAAALFITGLVRTDWKIVSSGMIALAAFWLAALIHAVTVAVATESIQPVAPIPSNTRQP